MGNLRHQNRIPRTLKPGDDLCFIIFRWGWIWDFGSFYNSREHESRAATKSSTLPSPDSIPRRSSERPAAGYGAKRYEYRSQSFKAKRILTRRPASADRSLPLFQP